MNSDRSENWIGIAKTTEKSKYLYPILNPKAHEVNCLFNKCFTRKPISVAILKIMLNQEYLKEAKWSGEYSHIAEVKLRSENISAKHESCKAL